MMILYINIETREEVTDIRRPIALAVRFDKTFNKTSVRPLPGDALVKSYEGRKKTKNDSPPPRLLLVVV
jgi:hypothetical protein